MPDEDVWLFGTVLASADGLCSVSIDGDITFTEVKVCRAEPLRVGDTAVLLRSGRRLVCFGTVAAWSGA